MKSVCLLVQNHYDFDVRVRRKAEALVGAGYSVDVLALRSKNQPKNYSLNGVSVYTISLGKLRGSLARYIFEYGAFFLWCFWYLMTRMPKRRYAIVDVNTLPDFLVFAALPARLLGAKLVLDMHEITPEFYRSKYGIPEDSWWVRIMKFQERISFEFADRVITIHEPIRNLLVSRGMSRAKSIVITNAADEARFISPKVSSAAEKAATQAKFVMMYHGTLTRFYGLDIAIEAFARVHKDMPGAQLWILGTGTERNSLAALAKERGLGDKVILVGQVRPEEIPSWLSKCDVGVLPIRRDVFLDFAFPNKLPEFIIMGKAVLMSRLKAIQYYFSAESLAYFEPGNPEALGEEMVRLFRDPDLRTRLTLQAKQEYMPIRWETMKEHYLDLMSKMSEPKIPGIELSRVSKEGMRQ